MKKGVVRKPKPVSSGKIAAVLKAAIEMGFIIFLFYSNLLMGEFTKANGAQAKTLAFALWDIFTAANFLIAAITSLIGYSAFEHLRKKL